MTLGKIRSRRDSFGLKVRTDGTLTLDLSRQDTTTIAVQPLANSFQGNSSGGGSDRSSSRPLLLRQAESESRKSQVGSLTKKRRRRDSFGLEVRPDGTLSLDQLVQAGCPLSRSEVPGEDVRADSSPGRDEFGRVSCDGVGSRHSLSLSRTTTPQSGRRRDSFGLEVRDDGTLSLDRLIDPAGTASGGENNRSSHFQPQTASQGTSAGSPNSARRYNGPTRTAGSGAFRGRIADARPSGVKGGGGQASGSQRVLANRSELEYLRARVRRLEAELTPPVRLPTRSSMDAPPAYQSRSGSPVQEQRQNGGSARGLVGGEPGEEPLSIDRNPDDALTAVHT
jgi:hypothetical protein